MDWRLRNQEDYLYKKKFYFCKYEPKDVWEHDHCEFCNEKFSKNPGDLHEGYSTKDRYYWVCVQCFKDFKKQFRWETDHQLL